MKQTSLKSIARHLAAVQSGKIEKTNIIGIRKAINAMEQSLQNPAALVDAIYALEELIAKRCPVVTGELHESGLKVLRNPRYAKRWSDYERHVINYLDHFELIRFDRVGNRGRYSVPVYRVVGICGVVEHSFAFRNISWQTAYYAGLDDGPRVVSEREE